MDRTPEAVKTAWLLRSLVMMQPTADVIEAIGKFVGMMAVHYCPESADDMIDKWMADAHEEARIKGGHDGEGDHR